MEKISEFISANPILAICICLALGYCIGFIKIRTFSFGATIGTLLVGFVLSRFFTFNIPGILGTVFTLLFCFTIGFEAGPAFFKSLKSNGIKFILQAVFFCAFAFVCLWLLGLSGLFDRDTVIGMAAGALTQTSILTVAEGLGDMASITYAVTYITGTLFAIVFASVIGPAVLRTSPIGAAKQKIDKTPATVNSADSESSARLAPVYPRAYRIKSGSRYVGITVEELEDLFGHTLEIVMLFREDKPFPLAQTVKIEEGDVITVIASIGQALRFDDEFTDEVSDTHYLAVEIVTKEIIVTKDTDVSAVDLLSAHGIVLRSALSPKEKKLRITDEMTLEKGMTVKVSGTPASIGKVATEIGYVKEIGSATDVPFVFAALVTAILFGAVKIAGFGLGDSTCALILGLVCGWYHNKNPKYGKFPEGTRWFLKSVGLNMFIAVKALTTGKFTFDTKMLLILGVGIAVTLVPHIVSALFSKHVLRMDDADVLGGQCGSGTCTAALNSLIDASGSSAFVASYATTNAIANILLTIVGLILALVL